MAGSKHTGRREIAGTLGFDTPPCLSEMELIAPSVFFPSLEFHPLRFLGLDLGSMRSFDFAYMLLLFLLVSARFSRDVCIFQPFFKDVLVKKYI